MQSPNTISIMRWPTNTPRNQYLVIRLCRFMRMAKQLAQQLASSLTGCYWDCWFYCSWSSDYNSELSQLITNSITNLRLRCPFGVSINCLVNRYFPVNHRFVRVAPKYSSNCYPVVGWHLLGNLASCFLEVVARPAPKTTIGNSGQGTQHCLVVPVDRSTDC